MEKDPNKMSREELVAMAKEFSGFNGNPNPEYNGGALGPEYDGFGDSHVDFVGKGHEGSFFNLNDSEPFQLNIVNSNAATRTFYLSSGLYYTGINAVVAGTAGIIAGITPILPAGMFPVAGGAFQALEDAVGANTLSISCPNPNQSILKFMNFIRWNASFSHIIQATSNQAVSQLTCLVLDGQTGVIRDEVPRSIPWRKYGDGDQYNLQFIDLKESLHMDDKNQIQMQVAGNSTLSLNIYISAADNGSSRLRKRVSAAKHTAHRHKKKHGNYDGLQRGGEVLPMLGGR